jgi:hypothetical protein
MGLSIADVGRREGQELSTEEHAENAEGIFSGVDDLPSIDVVFLMVNPDYIRSFPQIGEVMLCHLLRYTFLLGLAFLLQM